MPERKAKLVHLVGSASLSSAADVFREVSARVGGDIARIPDGETGERRTPFPFRPGLVAAVAETPGIIYKRIWDIAGMQIKLYGLEPGTDAETLELGRLGFADAAKASYQDYKRLRAEGKIPPGVRMQVCIPTPFMIALTFTAPEDLPALWPAFERAMFRELQEITDAIPHQDLAIQWDVAPEITEVLEGSNAEVMKYVSRAQIVDGLARVTDAVPLGVETGWHLCYGDTGQSTDDLETQHPVEPTDLGLLVALANDVCARVRRPVNWVHMPVPRTRDDEAYFAPLKHLRLKPGMQLFLGLVHRYDGLEGAKRRIAAARSAYPSFGVGAECGMGRRRPEDIPALLDLHHEIACAL